MPNNRQQQIEQEAARLFRQYSYHGTSMRAIAQAVGIEAASLYNHFISKQQLLDHLVTQANQQLLHAVQTAVAQAGDDPAERLRAAIWGFVSFYEGRVDLVTIADTELRGLSTQAAAQVQTAKDDLSSTFFDIVQDGVRSGVFKDRNPKIDTVFILGMGVVRAGTLRLSMWYDAQGHLELEKVASQMSRYALRGLGYRGEAA